MRSDEGAGERARQPRDEEDLRVDVVGKRDRPDRMRAPRLIGVDPTSGAVTIAAAASRPKPVRSREPPPERRRVTDRRSPARSANGNDDDGPAPRAG